MRAGKGWIALAAVALTVGAGACSSGAKSSVHSNATTSTTAKSQGAAGSTASIPSPVSALPTTTVKGQAPPAAAPAPAPTTKMTPAEAAQLILGITGQINQAENTPNGPRALTQAEAQAIVDAQNKALGIPVTKP